MRGAGIVAGALLLCPFGASVGQNAPAGNSRIVGTVVDSIRGVGLDGAQVMISGFPGTVTTDSAGRFAIAGLASGTYEVGAFHPLLDALGLTLTTKPFVLGRDSTAVANLATPSAKTLASRYCGSELTKSGPAAIAGRVRDPDTDEPVPGATISLAWVDISVSKQSGVVSTPHELHTVSDTSGFFKFCRLPEDLYGTVQATRSGVSTGEIAVSTSGNPLTFENLAIAPPRAVAATGAVRGKVLSPDDKPLAQARVEARPTGVSGVTGVDGTFSIDGIPTGTQLIVVRRLGFAPVGVPVNVTSRQPTDITVTLAPALNVLDPVLVTARRNYALEKRGFFQRQRAGWGKYFTRDDIKNRNPQFLTDILREVPGIRVSRAIGGTVIQSGNRPYGSGGGCTQLYVDGIQWRVRFPGDLDAFVSMRDVAGLEVYRPGSAPVQFRGFDQCAVIVVWTQMQDR
jgi:carboxypeptidase family protein/TonB-dependent receptor-like protein